MKNLKLIILILTAAFMGSCATAQVTTTQWTKRLAGQWVKKGDWRNGVKLTPHPSVNAIMFAQQYHADKALWDKVFTFLSSTNLDTITPGKYPIDGDKAFASITEGPSKEPAKTGWESHRKYIDLQYVIRGKEQIEVMPLATATVTKPYDEAKDGVAYSGTGETYTAVPGTFFLFFPDDVHRPNIKVDGFDVVKKLVIKIKVN